MRQSYWTLQECQEAEEIEYCGQKKGRQVVKIGPMHLKGVWIPFGNAQCMAQKEAIGHMMYLLFVEDIVSSINKNRGGVEDVNTGSSKTLKLKAALL